MSVDTTRYRPTRLVVAAVVLMCGAGAGWVYKAHVLGGIPLFSGSIDVVRAQAAGGARLPTWSSVLTAGFYLAFWSLVAALWMSWHSASLTSRIGLGALAAAALFGVAFDGSRNLVLLALAMPAVAAYLVLRPRRGATRMLRVGLVVGVIAIVVGGAFVGRLSQESTRASGRAFMKRELDRQPLPVRPFLPIYVTGVLPFDAYAGVYATVPGHYAWGDGAYSLRSLPDKLFPHGKPSYGGLVSTQFELRGMGAFWNVATYQAPAFADAGPTGVITASILLGLLFGCAYRAARGVRGLFPLAVIAYVVYYLVYMPYDNFLSFTLIAVYDLTALFVLDRLASYRRRAADAPRAA
jgi:oligosaccharide repeat unit polymerase